ncbi:MAG: DegT/DnrJ/EryC1/StrS family aminotransferase, partial [Lachnospiraceae bacterium]|nr:DegT/DnrJ/EryC1/StrS family aminotransferase [Lachnospiraceae bacterium]
LYILRLDREKLRIGRKQFFEALEAENVCCNVHYIPTYYFPYYEKLGYARGLCPKAEKLYEEIISLPLYYAMSNQDVRDVINAVTKIAEYYKR